MKRRKFPPVPADLSPASRALWPGLAADVAVATDGADVDFLLLAELLRTQDRLEEIRAVLRAEGLTIAGSKGQTRPHPLLVTENTYARALAEAYARLKLAPKDRDPYRVEVKPNGRLGAY